MARYTDIDKLIAEYDRVHVGPPGGARKLMEEAPIADVVPREEIAKIFEDIELCLMIHSFTSKSEDYIEGACDTMEWVDSKLAEIKKKHTEGE